MRTGLLCFLCFVFSCGAIGCGSDSEPAETHGVARQATHAQQVKREARRAARRRQLRQAHRAAARARRAAARRHARRIAARELAREERQARAAEEAAAAAEEADASECDPNYIGACLNPYSSDYDCAGGSGNGPDYTGPVTVVGEDHYGLDADGDGRGCE
jgi:hypothetical protein